MSDYNFKKSEFNSNLKTGNVNSILTRMFQSLLATLDMDASRYEYLIDRYITNARIPKNLKELASVRGNIKKELFKNAMTWRVFVKSLIFLGVKSFTIGISFPDKNENVYYEEHTTIFDFDLINRELFFGNQKETRKSNKGYKPIEGSEDSILSTLYNKIKDKIISAGISEAELMVNYIDKTNIANVQKDISSIKGNIKKELSKPGMSWRVFVKGLIFLGITNFVFKIQIYNFRGDMYKTGFSVILDHDTMDDSDD